MNTPLITWACIVGLLVIIIAIRLFRSVHSHSVRRHHLLTVGSEREEFFVPGDATSKTTEEYVYNEDDEL